jgi:hypothetical protein
MPPGRLKNPLSPVERLGYVCAGAAAMLAGLLWGRGAMLAAGVGGAMAAFNLWVMRRLLDRALLEAARGDGDRGARLILIGAVVKMVLLGAMAYVGLVVLHLPLGPFALGFFSFLPALVGGALYQAARGRIP